MYELGGKRLEEIASGEWKWPRQCQLAGILAISIVFNKIAWKLTCIHENIFAANFHWIAVHSYRRVLHHFARRHVVLPSMPRTGHTCTVKDPLAQRPAPVQASIVDSVVFAVNIRQSYRLAFHLEFSNSSRSDFVGLCGPRERHFAPRSSPHCYLQISIFYRGSGVCATITPFLKSSTISGFNRISVGRFASVI